MVVYLLSAFLCAATAPQAGPAINLDRDLKPEHPYLLAGRSDFDRIKRQILVDPVMRAWDRSLLKKAEAILPQAPSEYVIPDGLRLLATSRRVLDRVTLLSIMYRLHGDKRFLDRAWLELKAAAGFKDWNPKHFLDVAEMTNAFAIGYDWLYVDWTPEQRATIRTAILDKGLKPGLAAYKSKAWWSLSPFNWNQVCNGGLTMGALAVGREEPGIASAIVNESVVSIRRAIKSYGPDGAWAEGPGYWGYATTYTVVCLAALESALGTDYGLSQTPGFSEAGSFPIYASGPFGITFNYADAHEGRESAPALYWLASKFGRPEYAQYERSVGGPEPQSLIWWNPTLESKRTKPAVLDKYYRNCEVVSMRGALGDRDATWVAFKAGDNKAGHSHLDLGGFILDAQGERWASDLGADDYNLPAYFGNRRWTYYRLRAEGHNTLVLNPAETPDQDPRAACKIDRFVTTPNKAFGITDLTKAYGANARSVRRGIALVDRKHVLIQDEVRTERVTDLWWFLHTRADVELSADRRTATLQLNGKTMTARLLAPRDARFEVMAPEPMPVSPRPAKQATNDGCKLAVHLDALGAKTIAVLLSPDARAKVDVQPLDRW